MATSIRLPAVVAKLTTTLTRERALPVDGDVLVRMGEVVQPDDVIAEAMVAGEPTVVDAARELGCADGDVPKFMVKRAGDVVRRGELLAVKKGFLKLGGRTCFAPIDGVIGAGPSASGEVVINPLPTKVQLKAAIPGMVVEVVPDRGAIIRATAALVQGAAGVGFETSGKLVIVAPADGEIEMASIDSGHQGCVLVGGFIGSPALERAKSMGVRGVVVGGVSGDVFMRHRSEAEPLPLIVTDSFGAQSMDPGAHQVLASHVGRLAILLPGYRSIDRHFGVDGRGRSCGCDGWRDPLAEVVIPLDRGQAVSAAASITSLGEATVRLSRGAYAGRRGKMLGQSEGWSRLGTGAVARAVEVELEGGARAQVPRSNLEALG